VAETGEDLGTGEGSSGGGDRTKGRAVSVFGADYTGEGGRETMGKKRTGTRTVWIVKRKIDNQSERRVNK